MAQAAQVAIDFSIAEASLPFAKVVAENKLPLIIGTTGHSQEDVQAIQALAKEIPVLWSSNFSIGINLMFHLGETIARILENRFDAEVIEFHHRHKKDAPSGTAQELAKIIQDTWKLDESALCYGRHGNDVKRPRNQVGVHSVRGGDKASEHTLMFAGTGERLEVTHRASDRTVFASGSLTAAHWILGKDPGLYSMLDVLNLTPTH
ncbi:4-hydroxy-tetrahydrodipicolinate reductase [Kiloniella litopenaei]|uniref:4-hydroxy-tetrahydrodipicolinate reductase n=1 Tax=Kiloniella litopenaei TaxID=1549748 RepID=UPI003BAD80BA